MNDICPGYISLHVCQADSAVRSLRTFFRVSDIVSFVDLYPKDNVFINGNSTVIIEQGGNKTTPLYFIVEETVDEITKKIIESKYWEQVGLQRVEL